MLRLLIAIGGGLCLGVGCEERDLERVEYQLKCESAKTDQLVQKADFMKAQDHWGLPEKEGEMSRQEKLRIVEGILDARFSTPPLGDRSAEMERVKYLLLQEDEDGLKETWEAWRRDPESVAVDARQTTLSKEDFEEALKYAVYGKRAAREIMEREPRD